ncbi:MAG: copper amine oxidase N-terminal domain-containing protein [Peptococcaceae bacterium]|nr:copper amine oxidase N-terminal domain-containing protein [Peptococcaceae bacterium]
MKKASAIAVLVVVSLVFGIGIAWCSIWGTYAGFPIAKLLLNGQEQNLTSPPVIINGRTYVPLRFVSESLGAKVNWDEDNFTVNIETPQFISTKPEDVATKIIKLSSYRQWNLLYDYLHPDLQKLFTRDQFITEREKNGSIFAFIKEYSIDEATIIKEWTDSEGTRNTYYNVAEVPYMITFSGGTTFRGNFHLAKAPDGSWRFFWWPAKN